MTTEEPTGFDALCDAYEGASEPTRVEFLGWLSTRAEFLEWLARRRQACKFAGNSDPLRGIIAFNSDPF